MTDKDGIRTTLDWFGSCDFCRSQEGRHHCLLHGRTLKNMDLLTCRHWERKEDDNGEE